MQASCSLFEVLHNVEMFQLHRQVEVCFLKRFASCVADMKSVLNWVFRRRLFWRIFFYIIVAKNLLKSIWQIFLCQFSVLVLASFLAWARDVLCSRSVTDETTCSWAARGVLSPLPSPVVGVVDNTAFMKLLVKLLFDVTRTLVVSRRSQKDEWSQIYCVE